MRRATRQKLDGDGVTWMCRRNNSLAPKGLDRPGVGRSVKRRLARQRRQDARREVIGAAV